VIDIQSRIGAWHRQIFGATCNSIFERVHMKLDEEYREFLRAKQNGDIEEEMADMSICLFSLADRMGFDLMAAIEDKFSTVSCRTDQIERDKARGIE